MHIRTILLYIALTAAFSAFLGACYFGWLVWSDRALYVDARERAGSSFESDASKQQTRSLLRETKQSRADLDALTKIDLVRAVDILEEAGHDAGVELSVGDASTQSPEGGSSKVAIHNVLVVIRGNGTLPKLLHAAALLESVPIPSKVEEIEWERSGDAKENLWHMTVKLRILTAADIPA